MAHLSTKQLTEALKLRKLIDQLEAQVDSSKSKLQSLLSGVATKVKKKVGRPAKKKTGRKKGKVGRPKGKRGTRKGSQKDLVHQVLQDAGQPLTTDQILQGAKAKGYKSKSKDAKKTLGVMLYTDKAIKRAGRGLFTLAAKVAPNMTAKVAAKKK